MLMTQTAYAKTIGVKKQYITQLIDRGVVVLQNGKVSKSQADNAIENNKDPSRDAQRAANAAKKKTLLDEDMLPENSLASMSESERGEYDKKLIAEQKKLEQARESATAMGLNVSKEAMPNSLNKVKIFRELYMGKIAQLDFKKKNGEVVDKSVVEADAFETARIIRDQLLGMAVKIAPSLARVNNVAEIEKILEKEMLKILENLNA